MTDQKKEEKYLRIGLITRPHGIRGEVKVFPTTDDPSRFEGLKVIYVRKLGRISPLHPVLIRREKESLLISFSELTDRDGAEGLRNADLLIPREEAIPLSKNEFFIGDLIGCLVSTEEGRELGVLKEVMNTAANDVYVVKREGRSDLLLPAVTEVVKEVDPDEKQITVHLLPGLEDLNG